MLNKFLDLMESGKSIRQSLKEYSEFVDIANAEWERRNAEWDEWISEMEAEYDDRIRDYEKDVKRFDDAYKNVDSMKAYPGYLEMDGGLQTADDGNYYFILRDPDLDSETEDLHYDLSSDNYLDYADVDFNSDYIICYVVVEPGSDITPVRDLCDSYKDKNCTKIFDELESIDIVKEISFDTDSV